VSALNSDVLPLLGLPTSAIEKGFCIKDWAQRYLNILS
jgi:hypothetical protein